MPPVPTQLDYDTLRRQLRPLFWNEAVDLLRTLEKLPSADGTTDHVSDFARFLDHIFDYPADVMRAVLSAQTQWPEWGTIKPELDAKSAPVRAEFRALKARGVFKDPIRYLREDGHYD